MFLEPKVYSTIWRALFNKKTRKYTNTKSDVNVNKFLRELGYHNMLNIQKDLIWPTSQNINLYIY